MAYINQEMKQKVAVALKAALKDSGIKYSISINNHSSLRVTIKSAPAKYGLKALLKEREYGELSRHWKTSYSEVVSKLVDVIDTCMNVAGWYDKSDYQTDYCNTAYFKDIYLGRWDKPFIETE